MSGVIGTWAGPRSPGTAYVMLHHHVGDLDGHTGAWGFPRGGMGGVTSALAASARSFGAQIRTSSPVAHIDVAGSGDRGDAGERRGAAGPNRDHHGTSGDLVPAAAGPARPAGGFVQDIERWKSRSGTVKINLAVDRLPSFSARPDFDPEVHGGTIVLAESLDDVDGAFADAVAGRPRRCRSPTSASRACSTTRWHPQGTCRVDVHPVGAAHLERRSRTRRSLTPTPTGSWPGWRRWRRVSPSSVLHRQVIGPYDMENEYHLVGGNIFHGELTPGQMFHARPAAGYADLRTPVRGLYQAGRRPMVGVGLLGFRGECCSAGSAEFAAER